MGILDNTCGSRCSLDSGNRIIVCDQSIPDGSSSVSASKMGMEPEPSDSQKRIELGPDPDGHKL